jgi:hypothetical protein
MYIFVNYNEAFRRCIKIIFALKEDRFRLKIVKRIECPGWKAFPEHPEDKQVLSPTSVN